MAYNQTNIYTDQLGQANALMDIGILFVDTSNNQTINGTKTFTTLPQSNVDPTNSNDFATRSYTGNSVVARTQTNNITGTTTYGSNKYYYSGSISISNNAVGNTYTCRTNVTTSILLPAKTSLLQSDILVATDGQANLDQLFTFGTSNGQGMWVAVGTGTNILVVSNDGINWVPNANNLSSFFTTGYCIAFNGIMWIFGGNGGIAISYNCITWINISASVPAIGYPYSIVWNGYMWELGGENAGNTRNLWSYDGINWNIFTGSLGGYNCNGVAWNGYMWVGLADGVLKSGYSYNGITWNNAGASNGGRGKKVAWNGLMWVGVFIGTPNSIMYSFDGINWTGLGMILADNGAGIAWNGNMWVAVGGNGTGINGAYSYNGINWTGCNGLTIGSWNVVTTNGTMWIAGGSGTNKLAYSYDGINWILLGTNLNTGTNFVAWNGKKNILYLPMARTLALGQGTSTIAFSYAGTNNMVYDVSNIWIGAFTHLGLPTNTLFSIANAAAWNGYQWIAMGTTVGSLSTGNTIAVSTINKIGYNQVSGTNVGTNSIGGAGNVWTGLGNYIFSVSGNGVGWNGNVWVACGQGGNTLAYSPNGFSWFGLGTRIFTSVCNSVTWNGTYWLATGLGPGTNGNTLACSMDGIIWTGLGNNTFSNQAMTAVWSGTMWVAVGKTGNTMAISYDTSGNTWIGLGNIPGTSPFATPFSTSGNCIAVNTTRTMWVAGGVGTNTMAYSFDGYSWINIGSPFSTVVNSVIWNGKFWVASGTGSHTLAYSSDGINWTGEGTTVLTTAGQGIAANMGVGSAIIPTNYTTPTTAINPLWVIAGAGTYTLAYSVNEGQTWTGVSNTVFSIQGNCVAYSPTGTWIAYGAGSNHTQAFSNDGINWAGQGSTVFSGYGNYAVFNGIMWVAGGLGGNTLAYSYNGNVWTGIGSKVFTISGTDMAWSGQMWVATGQGGNSLAYSYDGINWTGLGNTIFTTVGMAISYNGIIWLASGQGTNTLAYSYNGLNWTGLSNTIFATSGNDITWNGSIWVAVGQGTNAIAWSPSGITSWTGLGFTIPATGNLTTGYSVVWSGKLWMVSGTGTSGCTVYSPNGKNWYTYSTPNTTMTTAYSVAYSNYFTNKLVLDRNGASGTQTLDIVADSYYQMGYSQVNYNLTFYGI
jgi:hypothetical protein